MGDFNAQSLAIVAEAFATAGHLDTQLFMVLARVAECCVGDFDAQQLELTE